MTWLYILIDVFILILLLAGIIAILYFFNKKKSLNVGSLSEFRNDTIYEKSYEDKKKKAHIEEIIDVNHDDSKEMVDDVDTFVDGIFFEDGYGDTEDSENEN